jgi:hypothetical protein
MWISYITSKGYFLSLKYIVNTVKTEFVTNQRTGCAVRSGTTGFCQHEDETKATTALPVPFQLTHISTNSMTCYVALRLLSSIPATLCAFCENHYIQMHVKVVYCTDNELKGKTLS